MSAEVPARFDIIEQFSMKKSLRTATAAVFVITALSVLSAATEACALSTVFTARGQGVVRISGSGSFEFTFKGFVIVSEEAVVTFDGDSAEPVQLDDGTLLYNAVDGSVGVSGSALEITLGGTNISLYAVCRGSALLTGSGYYTKGLSFGLWDAEGVSTEIGRGAD